MNINPNLWGRPVWDFFYFVALSYPKNPTYNDKEKYKNFFLTSGQVIPCDKCKNNFGKHIKEIPIDNYLDSSYNLFTWITKMQNKVSILNGKGEKTVDDNFQYYVSKINNSSSNFGGLSQKEKILISLVSFAILLFLLKKLKKI